MTVNFRGSIRRFLRRLRVDERAASAVEYAILVSAIAAVIIVAAATLGNQTDTNFDCTKDSMQNGADECAP